MLDTEHHVEICHDATAAVVVAHMLLLVVRQPFELLVFEEEILQVELSPATNLGREPFSQSHVKTRSHALGKHVAEVFLAWVIQCHVGTELQEPVLPEAFVAK